MKKKNIVARTAFSGMLSALGVVVLFLGAATGVMDLTAAVAASVFIAVAVVEMGGAYPYMIWAVTGVLSFVLLPDKSVAAEYTVVFGLYPVFKLYFERLGRAMEWVAKIVYCLAALGIFAVFLRLVLNVPGESLPLMLVLFAGYAVIFLLYDRALSVAMTLYTTKLRPKLPFVKRIR